MEGIVVVHEEPLFLDWKCTINPRNIPEWWHIKIPQGRYHVNPPTKHRLVLKQGNIKIESNKLSGEAMDQSMCDNYNCTNYLDDAGATQGELKTEVTIDGIGGDIKADIPYNTYYFLNPWLYNILPIPALLLNKDESSRIVLPQWFKHPGHVQKSTIVKQVNDYTAYKPRYYLPQTRWEFDPEGRTAEGRQLALGSVEAYRDVFPWSEMYLEAKSASSLQPDPLQASFDTTQYVPGNKVGKMDAQSSGIWHWSANRMDDDFNYELPHHDTNDLYFRVADSRGNSLKLLMEDMPASEREWSIFNPANPNQPKGKTISCQFSLVYQKYTTHAQAPNHERGGFTGYYKTAITDQHAV